MFGIYIYIYIYNFIIDFIDSRQNINQAAFFLLNYALCCWDASILNKLNFLENYQMWEIEWAGEHGIKSIHNS